MTFCQKLTLMILRTPPMKTIYTTLFALAIIIFFQPKSHAQHLVTWTDTLNVSITSNSISNLVPDEVGGWGNAGAASNESLSANTDGWVETTIVQTNRSRMLGLSEINSSAHYGSIDFAIYLPKTRQVQIYESGSLEYFDDSFTYDIGDVFRIERTGNTISYLKNESEFYASTTPSTSSLVVDVAFLGFDAKLKDVTVSPSFSGAPVPDDNQESVEARTAFLGTVAIGRETTLGDHLLSVEGSIAAKRVKVTLTGWADFVFEEGYELRDLKSLKAFIEKNGHLPDIPSTQEVLENGIALGEMNKKLLQKVEELTLYLLQQQARIEALEKKLEKRD